MSCMKLWMVVKGVGKGPGKEVLLYYFIYLRVFFLYAFSCTSRRKYLRIVRLFLHVELLSLFPLAN